MNTSPERLERNQALRATVGGLALVGLLALLAVGLVLSLMGCSKPAPADNWMLTDFYASLDKNCLEIKDEIGWCKVKYLGCPDKNVVSHCGTTYADGWDDAQCYRLQETFPIICTTDGKYKRPR